MFQDIDNMEASCVLYIKGGTFDLLEHSKICILTGNEMGIIMLTVQPDWTVSIRLIYDPRDFFRQITPDVLSLKEFPIHIRQ